MSKKKVLLTGGGGFIGTHLAQRLLRDHKVVVYDNFSRNSLGDVDFKDHPDLEVVKGDVLDFESLKGAMKGCSMIVHLAAITGIDTVVLRPTRTITVNLVGTYNVLEAAKQLGGCEKFIDFSTSEVFGSLAYKLDEGEQTPMGAVGEARWTYAVSKLAAEHLTYSYYKEFKIPAVTVRPFNIYGPGQVGESAIHIFIKRALRNETIEIHGDGDQIRSWCYIDDFIDGVMMCISEEAAVGEVINLGNPRGTITVYGLALLIKGVLESDAPLVFIPKNYVDVELRMPSIEKARKVLGFEPKIDLEEGIRRTAEWYRIRIGK
ncbi:MAG: NAD-dependent epimerase/dehydratase family protein [Candidatus Glassbacteria bacterium]